MDPIHADKVKKLSCWLLKDVDKAIDQYDMIENDDRIAVAISGGKNSLTLLKLLDFRRRYSPQEYSLLAIHILGNSLGPTKNIPLDLLAWLKESKGAVKNLPFCLYRPFTMHRMTRLPKKL